MADEFPKFRVTKTNPPKVFIQCSTCSKDIRELKPHESIHVGRTYHCEEHDPGVIVLNTPKPKGYYKDEGPEEVDE